MENLEILGSISLCIAAILVALIEVVFFSLCLPCLCGWSRNTAPFIMLHFASEGSIQSLELLLWKSEKDALTHVCRQTKG